MSKKIDTRDGFTHDDWLELCAYVEKDILGYDENMKIPRSLYLRLRGLSRGQFMANNSHAKYSEYSYSVILYTFKYSKVSIDNAIRSKSFKSENNKINYIMAIVESNMNDIYLRLLKVKESDKRTKELDLEENYVPQHYYKGDEDNDKKIDIIDIIDEEIW